MLTKTEYWPSVHIALASHSVVGIRLFEVEYFVRRDSNQSKGALLEEGMHKRVSKISNRSTVSSIDDNTQTLFIRESARHTIPRFPPFYWFYSLQKSKPDSDLE